MTTRPSSSRWFQLHDESKRNWLALGLLLAAWNLSDNDAVKPGAEKPVTLQKHALVTVRSARAHPV